MNRIFRSKTLLFLSAVFWCSASVVSAQDVFDRAEGDWGFELVPDMTCAANPARLRFSDDRRKAKFTWPKLVSYSDGTVSEAVTFSILSIDGNSINMRRDRDGEASYLILSADGMSYRFGLNKGKAAGEGESVFTRCDKLVG